PGDTVTYTLTAENDSEGKVGGLHVADHLEHVLDNATFGEVLEDDEDTEFHEDDEILAWKIPELDAGESRSINFTVTIDDDAHGVMIGNYITGKGSVPPDDCPGQILTQTGDDDEYAPCATIHNTPDKWTLSKESDPESGSGVSPGDTITYTVTAENLSKSDMDDLVVSDDLSDVLDTATFERFVDDDEGNASVDGDDLTWNIETIDAGETTSISYEVTVDGDAHGVTIGNVVTGDGDVPPDDCADDEPCE